MYGLAKRIYAIEPQAEEYKILEENCKKLKKIKPFNIALSNTNGYKWIDGEDSGGAVLYDNQTEHGVRIECKTLATFMRENNIKTVDVLKVDIEGHENKVFGSPDFKDVATKIKMIIGEHGGGLNKILEPLGFKRKDYRYGFIYRR
jgi:FkbM family methyltransferase